MRRNHPRPASLEPTVCQLFKGREAQSGWREQGPTGCRAQKSAIHPPSLAPSSSTSFFAGPRQLCGGRARPRTRVGPPPRAGTQAPLRAREPAPLAAHKRPGTRRLSGLAVGRVAPRRGRARRTRPCPHLEGTARRSIDGAGASPPPPRSRTNWTRLVPLPVLTGHVSSL